LGNNPFAKQPFRPATVFRFLAQAIIFVQIRIFDQLVFGQLTLPPTFPFFPFYLFSEKSNF
jgi:hypothetical protein